MTEVWWPSFRLRIYDKLPRISRLFWGQPAELQKWLGGFGGVQKMLRLLTLQRGEGYCQLSGQGKCEDIGWFVRNLAITSDLGWS